MATSTIISQSSKMNQKYNYRNVGEVFLQEVDYFFFDSYFFVSTEGRICHVPFRFRDKVKVGDHVICRICEYRRHRYDSETKKIVFDGEKYYCCSVQGYGSEEKMLEHWNADSELEREKENFIARRIDEIRKQKNLAKAVGKNSFHI